MSALLSAGPECIGRGVVLKLAIFPQTRAWIDKDGGQVLRRLITSQPTIEGAGVPLTRQQPAHPRYRRPLKFN